MPQERLSMRTIKEILRLRWVSAAGLSHREIAVSCRKGPTTVRDYLLRAKAAGLSWPLPEGMNEEELERLLFPPPAASSHRHPRAGAMPGTARDPGRSLPAPLHSGRLSAAGRQLA
ncbi:MAG: hypothetical protein MUQ26_01120 [Armatimonadetes bacterium]|nr:hypothetical protein [Armatimonadota bacterium]